MSFWNIFTTLAAPAKELAEVFTPNAERQAERSHEEQLALNDQDLASLRQFAAEFQSRDGRTFWDSFVDGLNRLPRPAITLGVLGLFVLAPLDPARFLELAKAYELMPDGFWALLSLIVAFYFGGRMQLTRQQMSVRGDALKTWRDLATLRRQLGTTEPAAAPVERQGSGPAAAPAAPEAPAGSGNRIVAEWRRRGRPHAA